MNSTKNVLGLILVILLVGIFAFAIFMNKQTASVFKKEGISTKAKITQKSSFERRKSVKSKANRGVSDTVYILHVDFSDQSGKSIQTGLSEWVTKDEYEKLNVGDEIEIVYLPKNPSDKLVTKADLERILGEKSFQ